MAVTLTGSGGLFTRLGLLGGIVGVDTSLAVADVNEYRGSLLAGKIPDILDEYAAGNDQRDIVSYLQSNLANWQSLQNIFLTQIQSIAQQTLIEMFNADSPLPELSTPVAMAALIAQMTSGGNTVQRSVPTAGSVTAVGSPNGNPVIVVSVKDANGNNLQYAIPETLRITCTADSQSGRATEGQELLQVTSPPGYQSLDWRYPGGSGCGSFVPGTLRAAAGGTLTRGGQLIAGGDFEDYATANVPDDWTVVAGAAGTDFLESTAQFYTGVASLQFAGGGATKVDLRQDITSSLLPSTQYSVVLWCRNSVMPAAGSFLVQLVDGSSVVVNDNAGTANTLTVAVNGLTAGAWTAYSGTFRTPAVLPSTVKVRLYVTTLISAGTQFYIDRLSMQPIPGIYPGGPGIGVHSGATKLIVNDAWTCALGNTYGLFQFLFDRLFGMRDLGQVVPNATSPSISDALIV